MMKNKLDIIIVKGKFFLENDTLMVQEYEGNALLLSDDKTMTLSISTTGEPFSLYDYIVGLPKENKINSLTINFVHSRDFSIMIDPVLIRNTWQGRGARIGSKTIVNEYDGNLKKRINNLMCSSELNQYCYMEIYVYYE